MESDVPPAETADADSTAYQEPRLEQPAGPGQLETPEPNAADWDFETLLTQGEAETKSEEEPPDEETIWTPPVYGQPRPRRSLSVQNQIRIIFIVLAVVVTVIFLPQIHSVWSPASPAAETQEWLERTFRVKLVSSPHNKDREEDRFLYWLEEDPKIRFQAIREAEGEYYTNFPNAMLFGTMADFAQEWPDYPLWFDPEMTDAQGEGTEGGAPPSLYLFQIPLEGAEGFLTALGDWLDEAAQTDWYRTQAPEYILALAHGEAILQSYDSTAGEIPTGEELLAFYREGMHGYLLEDLLFQQGVALWDYPEDDNLSWAQTGAGSVLDVEGYWITCYGTGRDGEDLIMYYFLREDYTALYCIPGEVMDHLDQMFTLSCIETLTVSCGRQIEIYRVL